VGVDRLGGGVEPAAGLGRLGGGVAPLGAPDRTGGGVETAGAPDPVGGLLDCPVAGALAATVGPLACGAAAVPGCCVAEPVGCGMAGPLGCGIAGPLLPAAARECESSPRLIVYDLNGGSSDEFAAAPVGAGADGPFGPDNSSGTNNTIKTTRMIAPVSRSFTRCSTVGTKPLQSSGHHSDNPPVWARGVQYARRLVYAKPSQCRADGVDRAEDDDPVTRNCRRARDLATCLDRGGQRNQRCGQLSSTR
jgi:hypothetical protein